MKRNLAASATFLLALSIWFLGERTNGWEIAGSLVSFVGVAFMIGLQGLWEHNMEVDVSLWHAHRRGG